MTSRINATNLHIKNNSTSNSIILDNSISTNYINTSSSGMSLVSPAAVIISSTLATSSGLYLTDSNNLSTIKSDNAGNLYLNNDIIFSSGASQITFTKGINFKDQANDASISSNNQGSLVMTAAYSIMLDVNGITFTVNPYSIYCNIGNSNLEFTNSQFNLNVSGSISIVSSVVNINSNLDVSGNINNLYINQDTSNNIIIGYESLQQNKGIYNTSIGYNSGQNTVSGNYNTYLGYQTGIDNSLNTYDYSTAIGYSAIITASNQIMMGATGSQACTVVIPGQLQFQDGTTQNTAGGGGGGGYWDLSGNNDIYNSNSSGNVDISNNLNVNGFINNLSLYVNDNYNITIATYNGNNTGYYNLGIGDALIANTGNNNIGIGSSTLSYNSGIFNIAIGNGSLYSNSGNFNTAVGIDTLIYNETGGCNTAIGVGALLYNETGAYNTAIGFNALNCLNVFDTPNTVDGSNNTAVGYNAGYNDFNGYANLYLGYNSNQLQSLDYTYNYIYNYSTAIGANATITGSNQIVLGGFNSSVYPTVYIPGNLDVSGNVDISNNLIVNGLINNLYINNNNNNTSIGLYSSQLITTGISNVAIGTYSLQLITTGARNVAIGTYSLQQNISGYSNTAIGAYSLQQNTTGYYNTAIGTYSLQKNNAGNYNVAIGANSLQQNISGYYNVAIGANSLQQNISGNYNTAIGTYSTANYNCNYSTAIGANAIITASNQIVLGGLNTIYPTVYIPGDLDVSGNLDVSSNVVVQGTVTASNFPLVSDYRIKTNVISLSDSFTVDNLNPVTYFNLNTKKQDIGLIAHELQEWYPCLVNGIKDGNTTQSVNYTGLIPVLINEIKLLKEREKTVEKMIYLVVIINLLIVIFS
jgi:hypothetical protein